MNFFRQKYLTCTAGAQRNKKQQANCNHKYTANINHSDYYFSKALMEYASSETTSLGSMPDFDIFSATPSAVYP